MSDSTSELERLTLENAQYKKELDSMALTMRMTLAAKNKKIAELEQALAASARAQLSAPPSPFDAHCGKIAPSSNKCSGDTLQESSWKEFRFMLPSIGRIFVNDTKVCSKPFMMGEIHWEVYLTKQDSSVGCYLRICEPAALNKDFVFIVSAKITLISTALDKKNHKTFVLFKPFNAAKHSWGWREIIDVEKLFNPKNEFVHTDSVLIKVEAVVYKQ